MNQPGRGRAVSRILVAGDWHGNSQWAYSLAAKARRLGIRRIVQLGDFGIWKGRGEPTKYLTALENICVHYGIDICAIGGNHENYDAVEVFERNNPRDDNGMVLLRDHVHWITRGRRWEWSDVRFGALGGAFSVDWYGRIPGESWWPEAEEVHLEDVERLGDEPLDVLITHDAPYGAEPSEGHWELSPQSEARSANNRRLVRRAVDATHPKLVFHGHWHVRNERTVEEPNGRIVRVEGLASDQERDGTAWGVLDLGDMSFRDGREIEGQWIREKLNEPDRP